MQAVRCDESSSTTEYDQEIGYRDPDDQLDLNPEAVQTLLESDLVTEHDGYPATGIRNGVIGGSLIWKFIVAIIFLLT